MNKSCVYIILAVLMLVPAGALSQSYSYKRYTPSDGLNQSQVEYLLQDSRGYLWIGTRNGLSLFDGRAFTRYYESDGLVDPFVKRVLEKSNGQIVVVTNLGFSVLGNNGFQPTEIFKKGSYNIIMNAFLDKNDNIFLVYRTGGNLSAVISYSRGVTKDMPWISEIPGGGICKGIIFDRNNERFIIETTDGLWQYRDREHKKLFSGNIGLVGHSVTGKILVKNNGIKYILKGRKLVPLEHGILKKENLLPLVSFTKNRIDFFTRSRHITIPWNREGIGSLLADHNNTLWVGTEYGLFHILSFDFLNFSRENGLANNIWSVVEDNKNNMWFASLEKSLQRWDGNELKSMDAYRKIFNKAFYSGGACTSDGRLLFSQSDGILQYKDGRFSKLPYGDFQAEKIYCSPLDSTIFIGFTNKGLLRIKGNNRKWTSDLSAGRHGWITDIAADPGGFYWIVSSKTIAKLYGDSLYVYPYDEAPVQNGFVVEVDSSGTAWFGGQEGLFMHEESTDSFKKVDIEGRMITINGMALMDNDRLLLGRMNDLVVVDIKAWRKGSNEYYTIYNESCGFMGREVQQDGIMRDHEGNYWISCIECVTKFMPSMGKKVPKPPLMNLFRVETMNSSYEWEEMYSPAMLINNQPGTVTLDHKKNSVKLHYRAVSGYATDDVEYSYRVKGLIDEWTTPGSQPEFTLADPEPGSYTIEARALNARGQYSDTVQTELHMALSPWQTVYFHIFISVITLIAGSLAGYHIYRYNNRRKEEKISLTREYYRLQMGRFVQQFDPHFAFNVISSIVAFIEVDDKEKANEYIVMFSNLLRKVIDRDDFAHSLDDEISFIKEYCEMQKLQMGDKLDYNLDIRNPESLVICVPRMMIHNFVENSIKWGIRHRKEGGRIDISVDSDSKNHVITVSDNGIGREAAKKLRTSSTGKGYNVTMNLVKILNRFNSKQMSVEINDLYDDDGKAAGTKVVVKVPAGFSMLNEAAERRCD